MTDKKLFLDWYNQYKNIHKNEYSPKNIEEWIDEVDKNHEELRNKIGGIRKCFEIELKTEQKPASESICYPIVNEILNIIPNYLKNYNFYKTIFLYPNIKTAKNISTSKHVSTYLSRAKVEKDQAEKVRVLLSKLGETWKKSKTDGSKTKINISTDPRAFVLLGKYGPDSGSCFNSFNSDKKYAIGTFPTSFVVIINKDNCEMKEEKEKNSYIRSIGSITDDVFNIFNGYGFGQNGVSQGNFDAAMSEISKELMEFSKPETIKSMMSIQGGMNYTDYYNISFFDKSKKGKIDKQIMTLTKKYSLEYHPNGDVYADR